MLDLWLKFEDGWVYWAFGKEARVDESRPTAALLNELFDLGDIIPRREFLPAPEDEAQSYLFGRLRDIRTSIDQMERETRARAQVHKESVRELDYQISQAALSLDRFHDWGVGYNAGVDVKRNFLERELSNLRRDRRNTVVRTWEDMTNLRKQLREAVAEYKSLRSRLELL